MRTIRTVEGLGAGDGLTAAAINEPAAAQAYGVGRTYPDYEKMLDRESLDAVIVVTPHATHYDIM